MAEKITPTQIEAFCCYYIMLGNVSEAAVRAGFARENALVSGIRCLSRPKCRKRIEELRGILADRRDVISGLKRLAFGSCSDAVNLVFADELPPPDVLGSLDLFNVSEIKRVKGGGVEVKLFDRLRAIEKLSELENTLSDADSAAGLIRALTGGCTEEGEEDDN